MIYVNLNVHCEISYEHVHRIQLDYDGIRRLEAVILVMNILFYKRR
jgi:hypothetical protein